MKVIAVHTLVVGNGKLAAPGTVVSIKDEDEAASLITRGAARPVQASSEVTEEAK